MSSSDEESYRETAAKNDTPRGTCWICQEKTKNPNAKQHKGCRQEQNLANKKRKKKLRKEKKKKKEKALKARKKLAKQKEQAKAKKRKRSNKDTGETGKPSKKSKSKSTKANTNTHTNTATTTTTTTTTSKNKNKNININKIEQPGGESKEDAIAPSPAVFVEDIENATVFKVERYNRVSSPDLQVKDGLEWRYVSIHVHKKDAHVVIWYGGVEYEGLGLKKGRRYTLLGLPEEDMFTGDNAQLLDGDGDSIEARRGPPKPLPTFQVHLYNQVSAERFQVEGAGPGEFRSCTLWELKVKENQHCHCYHNQLKWHISSQSSIRSQSFPPNILQRTIWKYHGHISPQGIPEDELKGCAGFFSKILMEHGFHVPLQAIDFNGNYKMPVVVGLGLDAE